MSSSNTPFQLPTGLQVGANTRTIISIGNTAQRPVTPANGEIRYNVDLQNFEFWFQGNTSWASPAGTFPNNATFNTVTIGNSTVNVFSNSTVLAIGGQSLLNSAGFGLGASVVNSTGYFAGANVSVNSTSVGIGNSTVSTVANSTSLSVGSSTTLNTSSLYLSGSLVVNTSWYTGTANNANNSAYLGGVAAASYALTSSLSAYQTAAGLSANVAHLTSNNASYLGGIAAANYWTQSSLVYVSQLVNNSGYITAASVPSYTSQLINNSGFITGLSSSGSYTVGVMSATSYLYSSGNVYAVGDVYSSWSDERLKDVTGKIKGEEALRAVCSWRTVRYRPNDLAVSLEAGDRGREYVGLFAQDVEADYPEVVGQGAIQGYKSVQYERLVPVLVAAIRELRREVDRLKGRTT